jgi:Raf kinase inhibitor-like YbhB/YbcL family protein
MFSLMSSDFEPNGVIPRVHTCEGANTSPALRWTGAPSGTKSYALIEDDPDAPDPAAPKRVWVHWVVYNIPAGSDSLPAALTGQSLPQGAREGLNDWNKPGYGGPCPPIGRHRYFHKLYALDVVLPDLGSPTKAQLLSAMQDHVLADAQLIGTSQKGE